MLCRSTFGSVFGAKARLLLRQLCEFEIRFRGFKISNSKVVKPGSCVIVNFGFSKTQTSFECCLTFEIQESAHSYASNSNETLQKLVSNFHSTVSKYNHPFVTSNFKAFRSLSFWLRNRELNFPLSFIRKLRLPSPATRTPSVARPKFHSLRPNDLPQSRKHESKTIGPVASSNAFPSRVANSGLQRSHSLTLMSLSHLRLHFTNKKRKQQKKLK